MKPEISLTNNEVRIEEEKVDKPADKLLKFNKMKKVKAKGTYNLKLVTAKETSKKRNNESTLQYRETKSNMIVHRLS